MHVSLFLTVALFIADFITPLSKRHEPSLRRLQSQTYASAEIIHEKTPHRLASQINEDPAAKSQNNNNAATLPAVNYQKDKIVSSAEATDDNKSNSQAEEQEKAISAYVSFFLCSLISAAILQWLVSHITVYSIPVSIIWFIFGMVISLIVQLIPEDLRNGYLITGIYYVGHMNAEIVYFILLPILLYEASLNCDWHRFKRFFISGVTLAVLGVFYQVGVVGLLAQWTLPFNKDVPKNTSWYNAFLIASALASTDPVAVTSVLNTLQAPLKLASMFEGEALINDGSSVLLFQFFKSLSRGDVETWHAILSRFVSLLFLGPIWGFAIGAVMYFWLRRFRRYPKMQILALVSVAHAVYFIGETALKTSGPISIVVFGLYYNAFGHIGLDHDAQLQHQHSVSAFAVLANSSIFIISGVVAMRMMYEAITIDNDLAMVQLWNVPVLYLYLLIGRSTMVIVFLPVLRRTGYGVNWKEVILLVWGGLRGAIVLAMGLMIEQDHHILSILRYQAVLYIAGSTFLILIINGVSFEALYKCLNPYPPKPFRRVYLERVMKLIDYQYLEERRILEDHWLFRGTGILYFADKAVPVLGWRRMDRMGKIDFKLPSLTSSFRDLPTCDSWIPPFLLPPTIQPTLSDSVMDFRDSTKLSGSGGQITITIPSPQSDTSSRVRLSGTRPLEKLRNLEGTRQEGEGEEKEAEQRAHATSAALLGLRENRPGLDIFDPKLFLRLVEHISDDTEIPEASITTPMETKLTSNIDSRDFAIRKYIQDDENSESENGFPYMKRSDTDATIIFPSIKIPNESSHLHRSDRIGNILSRKFNLHWPQHRSPGSESLPHHDLAQPNEPPEFSSLNPMISNGALPDSSLNTHNSVRRRTFENPSPRQISNKENHASESDSSTNLATEMVVPSYVSEPLGSTRLDESRLYFGRMTRLRNNEWDNRRISTIAVPRRQYGFDIPRYYSQGDFSNEPLTYSDYCRSAFEAPPPDYSRVSAPSAGRSIGITVHDSQKHHRLKKWIDKKHEKQVSTKTVKTVDNQGSPPIRKKQSFPFLKQQRDRTEQETTIRKQKLLKSLKSRSGLPDHVSSAPTGHLDLGSLGFDNQQPQPVLDTSSIGSAEEYLEIPETPTIGKDKPVARVKVLRKEREGELMIMVFNAVREMYRRLYAQHFIRGAAMLSLNAVLDHSTDFAIGKLRKNPIKAWRNVLEGMPDEINDIGILNDVKVTITELEEMTGFEFEWRALACRLRCIQRRSFSRWLSNQFPKHSWLRATITYASAMSDLEEITAFVDVHEELLFKGGPSLEQLLGPKLLFSFRKQIYEAKRFVLLLRSTYPESFPYILTVHAATLLVNLKQQLIDEQAQKGLILDEDSKALNELFEEQHQNLSSYRPVDLSCFMWLGLNFRRYSSMKPTESSMLNLEVESDDESERIKKKQDLPPNGLMGDTKSTGDNIRLEWKIQQQ